MELTVTMIPAPEDPDGRGPGYQKQLSEFAKSLTKAGVEYEPSRRVLLTETSGFIYYGTFVIQLIEGLGSTVAAVAAVAECLRGRSVRKVRLKVGDIEAEATTVGEVEKLLKPWLKPAKKNQQRRVSRKKLPKSG
jgi:hypothetical protein